MGRLSPNEVRARAAAFARKFADATYERGESQTFYNEFFAIFGVERRQVASFEYAVKKSENRKGFIDLFWKGVLLVEQKSAGRDLTRARNQAFDYFPGLKPSELPRYILASDFQSFQLLDLEEGQEVFFPLAELPDQIERFDFILGRERRTFKDQDPVNVEASEIMGKLHDALEANGYRGHDLEVFLVRLVFCLFADDTGIFEPRGIFEDLIVNRTSEDGSDVGPLLAQLFQTLDEPEADRFKNLDGDLARFPYVNGDLFSRPLRLPSFDRKMRERLLEASAFNWTKISPAIFGALFQSVMDGGERRRQGAHYTTERNILKVIRPLFLDELREAFVRADERKTGRRQALQALHDRISALRFFDPACGCGNFLIIAYRELRQLELDILIALKTEESGVLDIEQLVRLNVGQFYGIELNEFPARIAETALWMMDHIMNVRVSEAFGQSFVRIPLQVSPHIQHADALETAWDDILPASECDYLLGNPPFIGAKYQTPAQREQVRRVAQLGGTGGSLDYVAAWFLRGADYARRGKARIGFVSTNSLSQGEQVAQLWPALFDRYGMEIAFAHRTFAWGSDARGMAHVHVIVLGLVRREDEPPIKRLFSYPALSGDPVESPHSRLSPYLMDAGRLANSHVVVREEGWPINGARRLLTGSKPIDGGHYIFDRAERDAFLAAEPGAARFLRPFLGAEEFIRSKERWILALHDATPSELAASPRVRERMERVRAYRAASASAPTRAIAASPTLYHVNVLPTRPYLVIPYVSSERRDYIPIGWIEPPTIPSDLLRVLADATLWEFGVLTSRMHMAWIRTIGGRLESRLRYSVGMCYNPFPWPALPAGEAGERNRARIEGLAQAVLDARAAHAGEPFARLYDPLLMPPGLRRAHAALDAAVDRLYSAAPFADDAARVELLLGRYEALVAPLTAAPKRRGRGAGTQASPQS